MNKNKKYRIAWRSILTGNVGFGEPVFWSHTIASHVAKQLDEDFPDKDHWVVDADESGDGLLVGNTDDQVAGVAVQQGA
jgi:hypothetical protein